MKNVKGVRTRELKNIEIAILEVEEHGYQTIETNDIVKSKFIEDVNRWLAMDKDHKYSQVDVYEMVSKFLS